MRPASDPRPALLTFSGTGSDMWTGYPADAARAVEDRWYFQPVHYPAAPFPMGRSVDQGVREAVELINRLPGPVGLVGYSQGGIVASLLLEEFRRAGGALKRREDDLIAAAMFGNPHREKGAYVGLRNPGGRGISHQRIEGTPEFWHEYVDPGDIYANVPDNDVGEDMTAIYRLVQLRSILDVIGPGNTLGEQVLETLHSPLREVPAMVEAIVRALLFFGSKPACAAHVEYHVREVLPGVTHFDHAVEHLRLRAQEAIAA